MIVMIYVIYTHLKLVYDLVLWQGGMPPCLTNPKPCTPSILTRGHAPLSYKSKTLHTNSNRMYLIYLIIMMLLPSFIWAAARAAPYQSSSSFNPENLDSDILLHLGSRKGCTLPLLFILQSWNPNSDILQLSELWLLWFMWFILI